MAKPDEEQSVLSWILWPWATVGGLLLVLPAILLVKTEPRLLYAVVLFHTVRGILSMFHLAGPSHGWVLKTYRELDRKLSLLNAAFESLSVDERQERLSLALGRIEYPQKFRTEVLGNTSYGKGQAARDLFLGAELLSGAGCLHVASLWENGGLGHEEVGCVSVWCTTPQQALEYWLRLAADRGERQAIGRLEAIRAAEEEHRHREEQNRLRYLQLEERREELAAQQRQLSKQLAEDLGVPIWLISPYEKVFRLVDQRSPPERMLLIALVRIFRLIPRGKCFDGSFRVVPQYPIKNYRADFLIGDRLVVEVDGAAFHDGREDYDLDRDAAISSMGYRTVRIPAREILADASAAARKVAREWEAMRSSE